MKVKVGINGYGTIGKRVATAVNQQDDMEIIGITKTRPTYEAKDAARQGYPIYVPAESVDAFKEAGIAIAGTVDDMIKAADIIVDCTPGKLAEEYKAKYAAAGKKAIWQGGEDHSLTGISFNATANYSESWGAQFSRVVSCNTTGLLRTLFNIDKNFKIKNAYVTLIRRSADPNDSKNGPINAIEPSVKLPTHHGPDVQSIMPWLSINTMAVKVPTTLMHVHTIVAELGSEVTTEQVKEVIKSCPRVRLVKSKDGIKSTAQIMDLARELGRTRGDMFEIVVWEDVIKVVGNTIYYYQAVNQESDVIPENIDCIRSMCKLEKDAAASMAKTDKAMGI
ncbi:MAG: type II glyceraldehyde-3-phosphate dehydrogenase [Candidatus Methanomethylophilaceae archaeon]|nr:type II glyceraldehyde-3-phosphate dehydrogenase [Candidatus Methanomethylophilaceae archaeon]